MSSMLLCTPETNKKKSKWHQRRCTHTPDCHQKEQCTEISARCRWRNCRIWCGWRRKGCRSSQCDCPRWSFCRREPLCCWSAPLQMWLLWQIPGPPSNTSEIGEIKDGVPEGAQLQGWDRQNPTYRPRYHRGSPHPWSALAVGEAKDKENHKWSMVQISHLLTVNTGAHKNIGIVPILLILLHKVAKRPRQVKHHLRTLLQLPSRAVLSTRLPRHLHH